MTLNRTGKTLVTALAGASLLAALACKPAPTAPAAPAPKEAAAAPAAAPAAQAQPAGPDAPFLQAAQTYLETVKNINTAKMTIAVKDVKVEGTKATATVLCGVKGDDTVPPMSYTYDFVQENGVWKAVKSAQAGGAGHGGMAMPPGDAGSAGGDLPAGHPAVEGMPSGHPPVEGMPAHGSTAQPPATGTPAKTK